MGRVGTWNKCSEISVRNVIPDDHK